MFPGLVWLFLSSNREVFHHYFLDRFSIPCSFSSPSGIPIIQILLHFMLPCISLKPSSFFLRLFSLSCSFWVFFSSSSSSSLILPFASLSLPLIPSTVFFSSEIDLHLLFSLVDSFYILFHVDIVCREFIIISLLFLVILSELIELP